MLFRTVNNILNPRVALFFLFAMVFSPGMFHASAAYLPSSFAMYCTMLGMSSFMNWRGGLKTAWGISWFAIGGILGWPFAMALSFPYLVEEVILASLSSKDAFIDTLIRSGRGIVVGLLVLVSSYFQTLCSVLRRLVFRVCHHWVLLQKTGLGAIEYCSLQHLQRPWSWSRNLRHRTMGLLLPKSSPEFQHLVRASPIGPATIRNTESLATWSSKYRERPTNNRLHEPVLSLARNIQFPTPQRRTLHVSYVSMLGLKRSYVPAPSPCCHRELRPKIPRRENTSPTKAHPRAYSIYWIYRSRCSQDIRHVHCILSSSENLSSAG